jgi:hypothetical protein
MENDKMLFTQIWDGYCPESKLKGKTVRMRLNKWGFYESEETGLMIANSFPGIQCVILKFRGKGDFHESIQYADEHVDGEVLSPQTMDRPPFGDLNIFTDGMEIEKYIKSEVKKEEKFAECI